MQKKLNNKHYYFKEKWLQTDSVSSSCILKDTFSSYWDIFLGLTFALIAFYFHVYTHTTLSTLSSAIAIGFLSFTVSNVAEVLAEKLGEPYGSFVLTFSAIAVEILLLFMVLLHADGNSIETVKSGIISAVIVDMNVLLGLAMLVGGIFYKEQKHNEETSSTYTTILFISAIALLVPSLLVFNSVGAEDTENLKLASVIVAAILVIYYFIILFFQIKTHSYFFTYYRGRMHKKEQHLKRIGQIDEEEKEYIFEELSISTNLLIIFSLILVVGFLAEIFAQDGSVFFQEHNFSIGLVGLIIAIISVSPELFTAIKAARKDEIQRVMNIAMGASTVSILITVPVIMILAQMIGINNFTLNFNSLQIGALLFTVILAWKTTLNGETNYIDGIAHLLFFVLFAVISALYLG